MPQGVGVQVPPRALFLKVTSGTNVSEAKNKRVHEAGEKIRACGPKGVQLLEAERRGHWKRSSWERSLHLTSEGPNSNHPVVPIGAALVLVEDLELALFVKNEGAGRHAVGEENAGGDRGASTHDGISPHDRGACVEGDVVFQRGMALFTPKSLAAR